MLFIALVSLAPRAARANGAFPESFQLLVPADRPKQIVLGTNFGLILSDDDGASWTWTCEQAQTLNGSLFAVGAPPMDRFYSVSSLTGLAYSDDDSCTWKVARGTVERMLTTDFFPDPANPLRVFAIGQDPDGATTPQVYPSDDGGATFGAAIFVTTSVDTLTGVESARSAPQTIYLAMFSSPGIHPKLVRSTNGGAQWTTIDVEPFLGQNNFRIIAVDPTDAKVLTLRVIEPLGESVAVSRDGGDTFTKVSTLAGGILTGYVKLDSGTVLVAGAVLDQARGFRSTDGGMTFQDWPQVAHLRALGTRGGKLYAAAKNYSDDWAVGVSTDEGQTFTPLTRYDQVKSIRACAQAICLESCKTLVARQVWDRGVCEVPEPPEGLPEPPAAKSGCGCGVASQPGPLAWSALAALALVGAALAGRRCRQSR